MARRLGRNTSEDGVRFPIALTVICILIACVLLWLDRPSQRVEPLSQFRASFNDMTSPGLALASRPVSGIENIGPWWKRQRQLAEENRQLRIQNAEMRAWRDMALSLQERNRRFSEALNVQGAATSQRITGWAVADQTTDFVHSRLVSTGARSGVRPGYPAVNLFGLIGRTVDVGQTSTRVLLLTDLNSRVAVMSDRSNSRALLVGDNSDFPRLDYLGIDPDLREGDRIVTSGDDNVMPRGLPVGEAVLDREGNWRVALYSRNAPIDLIWIWPFEPTPLPAATLVEPVGEAPVHTDIAEETGEAGAPETQQDLEGEG